MRMKNTRANPTKVGWSGGRCLTDTLCRRILLYMVGSTDDANLSMGDIGVLSDMTSEIYAPLFNDDSLRHVVGLLGRVVYQSEAGVVHLHPPNEPLWFGFGIREDAVNQRVALRPEILDLVRSALDRKLSVWRPEDAVGRERWIESPLHRQMSAGGLAHLVCVSFELDPEESTHFHFAREAGMADFTGRDLTMLRLFRHHLLSASLLRKALDEAKVVQLAFQQIKQPGFVADAECRILRMNDEARRFVEGCGEGEEKVVRQIEEGARRLISEGAEWESLDICGARNLLTVYPVRIDGLPTRHILAMNSAKYLRDILSQCMTVGGLTERETEICNLLIRGRSNREIALALDILDPTVKDHVTSILRKFGVTSRSAVVPRLLGLD